MTYIKINNFLIKMNNLLKIFLTFKIIKKETYYKKIYKLHKESKLIK
jgi:hypothetical protein